MRLDHLLSGIRDESRERPHLSVVGDGTVYGRSVLSGSVAQLVRAPS